MATVARRESERLVLAVDRAAAALAARWLWLANGVAALGLGLPALAPWLEANGQHGPALAIFLLFRPICHQRPERSFFLFGEQMAQCQRNTAIFAAVLLAGLAFALLRHRLRALHWRWFLLWVAPLAVDGLTQLTTLRESTWELRVITGTLFGIGAVWYVYPTVEQLTRDLIRAVGARVVAAAPSAATTET